MSAAVKRSANTDGNQPAKKGKFAADPNKKFNARPQREGKTNNPFNKPFSKQGNNVVS